MDIGLRLVSCASRAPVLRSRLLASPCVARRQLALSVYVGADSAAAAFNAELDLAPCSATDEWLVWVHEDVHLPAGWDERFAAGLRAARQRSARVAVAGVYGLTGDGTPAGCVWDRDRWLHGRAALPCAVDSLDELLVAVRRDSGLRLDAVLGFDFYAADVVQQAQARDLEAVVVDAPCEHWSALAREAPPAPARLAQWVASGALFEAKWAHRLPLHLPCLSIGAPGDVAAMAQRVAGGGQ